MDKTSLVVGVIGVLVIGAVAFALTRDNMQEVTDNTNTDNQTATTTNTNTGNPGQAMPIPYDQPPVKQAREDLAAKLKIAATDVSVRETLPRDWTDGCLGLGGAAESCLAAITPGYLVTLEAKGKIYLYRTNTDGTSVRAETTI